MFERCNFFERPEQAQGTEGRAGVGNQQITQVLSRICIRLCSQGDSGGPLQHKVKVNGTELWQVNGITSWGYGCASMHELSTVTIRYCTIQYMLLYQRNLVMS